MSLTRIMRLRADLKDRVEPLLAHMRDINRSPPILIYQMGKVGSSTVYNTLRSARVGMPIYQVHFLTPEGIKSVEALYPKWHLPNHLRLSKAIYKKIASNLGDVQWKIITLVRDPISRQLSDMFENAEIIAPELAYMMRTNSAAVLDLVATRMTEFNEETDYVSTWFDKELKKFFHVDVYRHPFDHNKGYSIIREKNISILVLRMEGMSGIASEAFRDFLNRDITFEIVNSNTGLTKSYALAYEDLLKHIRIPKTVCERIYATKYAMHFYSRDMREVFAKRWSGAYIGDGPS